ncbi:MAG: exopolysaccharide biosynthesis polyprenyl glycosylphosphotransferase [Rubrivivax sp. SCN 71-131]|jgi:sugar transferase (PEP-CTERM system associated)|nr:MAG: exopolysaccharide biosynthesis polyprenyl glycosylphosphotransferase [Rubrivivax sp. SCN 71-131]
MIRVFSHYLYRQSVLRVAVDLAFLLLAMLLAFVAFADPLGEAMRQAGGPVLSVAAGLFVAHTGAGFYQRGSRFTGVQALARAALALAIVLPLSWFVFGMLPEDLANRSAIRFAAVFGAGAVVLRRLYVTLSGADPLSRTRILIFGAGNAAATVGTTLQASDPNALIVGYLAGPNEKQVSVPRAELLESSGKTLTETARRLQVDEIVVALTERRSGSMPLRELLDCKLSGIKVYDIATHFEKTLGQIRIDYVNAGWLIFGSGFNQGFARTLMKRLFDVLCALVLIVLSLPVMALAALLIKLESPGPVLYRQERVGQNGRSFQVAKFRSMRNDAEKDGKPVWAAANDSRVTRVGAVMRKLRIDELPQLFNVLKGEMSLVGPRPERPFFVEQLTAEIPYFAARHSVKPGVTGWAQVRYPYGATVEDSQEKLQYDLYYVKNHSLFLDLIILFETVLVVLTARGAR